jgi:hypothetical protein
MKLFVYSILKNINRCLIHQKGAILRTHVFMVRLEWLGENESVARFEPPKRWKNENVGSCAYTLIRKVSNKINPSTKNHTPFGSTDFLTLRKICLVGRLSRK